MHPSPLHQPPLYHPVPPVPDDGGGGYALPFGQELAAATRSELETKVKTLLESLREAEGLAFDGTIDGEGI